jgi:hypothetical protein
MTKYAHLKLIRIGRNKKEAKVILLLPMGKITNRYNGGNGVAKQY